MRRAHLRPAFVVAPAAVVTFVTLLVGLQATSEQRARVEVDLFASEGTRVAVHVNDLTRAPQTQRLVPGERRVYEFDAGIADITLLRLDPTDAGAAGIELHSIRMVGRDGLIARFGPISLADWTLAGLTIDERSPDFLGLRTAEPHSYMFIRTAIPLSRVAPFWTGWLTAVGDPEFPWRAGAVSLVLLLVASSFERARRLYLLLAIAAAALVAAILAMVPLLPDRPQTAAVAVSRATLLGVSLLEPRVASIMLAVGATLLGAAAAWIQSRRQHRRREHLTATNSVLSQEAPVGTVPVGIWSGAGAVAVLGVVLWPDLSGAAQALATLEFVPHWDSDNLLYWAYLTHNGHLPFRDFWYAYGGFFAFDLPFPTGPLLRWTYHVAVLGTFWTILARWRGVVPATFAVALVFCGGRLGLLPAFERYLLALNIVLAYATADRGAPAMRTRALFFISCGLALLAEPAQLVFAAVPIALALVFDACDQHRAGSLRARWLAERLRADFAVPLSIALMYLMVLALSRQLQGFLMFYGRLGDSAAYSAWPTGLPSLALDAASSELLLLATAAILIAAGVYERWIRLGAPQFGEALFGVGLLIVMVLQKHFIRSMTEQLLLLLVAGVLVAAVGWRGRRCTVEYVVAGVTLGLAGAIVAGSPGAAPLAHAVAKAPSRLVSDAALLARGGDVIRTANAARFAPERFGLYVAERQVFARLRAHAGSDGDLRVFALTDAPILYVLTGQPPVWSANLYNASPVYEQERIVKWLDEEQPPYVVLDPDRLNWDGFQKVVRAPIVFSAVVDRYVPFDSVGRIDLLRLRAPGEPMALAFWRERLGAWVDIGHLARVSSFQESDDCHAACGDLLVVKTPSGDGRVTVALLIDELTFLLTFDRVPGENVYRVLLDRVWFWHAAKRADLARGLEVSTPAGVRARIVPVPLKEGVLF